MGENKLAFRLFLLSFISLFLELMIIRWIPAVIRLAAYYANLMLISSFLGLGLGCLMAGRKKNLLTWFPWCLSAYVVFLILCQSVILPAGIHEFRFLGKTAHWIDYVILIGLFVLNTIVFLPLGQSIGQVFRELPPLRGYFWDLGGSLLGTLSFGVFSFFYFSPAIGLTFVSLSALILIPKGKRWISGFLFAGVLATVLLFGRAGIWSPYYWISFHDIAKPTDPACPLPPDNLRTMMNPPVFQVSVNQDFYQFHGAIDRHRYTAEYAQSSLIQFLQNQYLLPYVLKRNPGRVAVLGSGGGMDAEAALIGGAREVDAVDIDPVLIDLSRKLNASGVYHHPKVHIHVEDARAFINQATQGYDMIVYGFLDSQALSSYMGNLRLDGFTYTVEGLRRAYELLNPNGMMTISFAAGQSWLGPKLFLMTKQATGRTPVAYVSSPQVIIAAFKGDTPILPERVGRFVATRYQDLRWTSATDDWPYLYLSNPTVPAEYLWVIVPLSLLSFLMVFQLSARRLDLESGHAFFLGFGFLLLETRSISDSALYIGTSWLVTMLVVSGVLLMVMAANAVAARRKRSSSSWLYVPLFLSLIGLLIMPRELILGFPFIVRMLFTILIVPIPIFFAGLIFSSSFKQSTNTSFFLGANLVGATIGGFAEYAGMAIGMQMTMGLVIAAYLASLLCKVRIPFRSWASCK